MNGTRIANYLAGKVTILPFHRRWLGRVFAPDVQIGVLSCTRGSAKTWLFGQLGAASITPDSQLFERGIETLIVSASLEQSRTMLGFVREALGDDADREYRFLDSGQRLAVTHKPTATRLRVLSSDGKRAMGLANYRTILADEPGAWQSRGGALMWDALRQSLGKRPNQRLLMIGTRAPGDPNGWWCNLLEAGSGDGVHVEVIAAPEDREDDPQPWDSWRVIRKANPLIMANPTLRKTILRERNRARRDPSERASFEAYRLNRNVDVRSEVLISLADWKGVEARPVPDRAGKPILALDLGSTRSWSAAWVLYSSGRSELYAMAPGIPSLAEVEKRDGLQKNIYRQLQDAGVLIIDEGVRVSRPSKLIDHLVALGIRPAVTICDTHAANALRDCVNGRWPIRIRKQKWEQATEDIAAFRKLVYDGPLSVAPEGRPLARLGLREVDVRSDDSGSASRLFKRRGDRSRDDPAQAGVLAAGLFARSNFGARVPRKPPRLVTFG